MVAERAIRWGPDRLSEVLADQLAQHGFVGPDAAAMCAEQLASSVGPAARASLFVDLGACKFLGGDVAGAIASWRQAVVSGQVAPASRALFNLGLLHHHVQLFDQAIELFASAIAHDVEPYASLATLGMARSYDAAGNESRAMATMARLADALMLQVPESPLLGETLLGLGQIAEAAGQVDRAEQAYRAAAGSEDDQVRDGAVFALVKILRFVGHDEEAHELVESSGLGDSEPTVLIDRIELLARLGRIDEALVLIRDVQTESLSVHDRFRFVGLQLDLGLVNEAVDGLEALGKFDAAETRARAAFSLGEVYLRHDMRDPALAMLDAVSTIDSGYWADKAALLLGDLAIERGDSRTAAARWADAAGSQVGSIASIARERLVAAVEVAAEVEIAPASPAAQVAVPSVAIIMAEAGDGDEVNHAGEVDVAALATQAVDMSGIDDDSMPLEDEPEEPMMVPEPSAPIVVALRRRSDASDVDSAAAQPADPVASEPEPIVIALGAPRTASAVPNAEVAEDNTGTADSWDRNGTNKAGAIDLRLNDGTNPYAALAPEALHDDPVPSDRNPYAELAPNFGGAPTSAPSPVVAVVPEPDIEPVSAPDTDPDPDGHTSPFSQFT